MYPVSSTLVSVAPSPRNKTPSVVVPVSATLNTWTSSTVWGQLHRVMSRTPIGRCNFSSSIARVQLISLDMEMSLLHSCVGETW